jgi:hypothetical protein
VPNGDETTVASLALPAGRYLVTEKAYLFNAVHDADWECFLKQDGTPFDRMGLDTESQGTFSGGITRAAVPMEGIVRFASSGNVTMTCASGETDSYVESIKIIAIQVAT